MLLKVFLFFLFNSFLTIVCGQDEFVAMSAKVNDAKSHTGVPAASIQLKSPELELLQIVPELLFLKYQSLHLMIHW